MSNQPFVTFTPDFIATMYPGYFFNVEDNKLYSLKIDGVLKPLKYYKANYWNKMDVHPVKLSDGSRVYSKGGYVVSVEGRRRVYPIEKLKDLKHEQSVIPVKETA